MTRALMNAIFLAGGVMAAFAPPLSAQARTPCIPGDPVRRDCPSSPTYNRVPGDPRVTTDPGYRAQQNSAPTRVPNGQPVPTRSGNTGTQPYGTAPYRSPY